MGKLPETITPDTISNLNVNTESEEYKEVIKKMKTTKKSCCGPGCACEDPRADLKLKFS